jgi:P-type Cu+ transporter
VEPAGFKAEAGHGVQAEVEGRSVMVGNKRMFEARGIQLGTLESEVSRLQSEAKTAMLVAIDDVAAGIIAVADTIKDSSKEAIADLHKMGLKVAMITGDNQKPPKRSRNKSAWIRCSRKFCPKVNLRK